MGYCRVVDQFNWIVTFLFTFQFSFKSGDEKRHGGSKKRGVTLQKQNVSQKINISGISTAVYFQLFSSQSFSQTKSIGQGWITQFLALPGCYILQLAYFNWLIQQLLSIYIYFDVVQKWASCLQL